MKLRYTLILFMAGIITLTKEADAQLRETISWSVAAHLPVLEGMQTQLGLAGVFTGVSGDVLIVAGGSNFENGVMPWRGGKKVYLDDIYVLKRISKDNFIWKTVNTGHLPEKIAYGASTTVAGGIICAGGETGAGKDSRNAFMMHWDKVNKELRISQLQPLPVATANACMTSIGEMVYVIGGENSGKPTASCFSLNLAEKNGQWHKVAALPAAMSHSVAVTQSNGQHPCIYVTGGRSATASGISILHNFLYCFDPVKEKWTHLSAVGEGIGITNISAATGVPYGTDEILLIGGDKGDIFHRLETYNAQIAREKNKDEKQRLQTEKAAVLDNHPGFSKTVYAYNTIQNKWSVIGRVPFYGQVTTTAVLWDHEIFIPCGEIKPGTRTAEITRGTIKLTK